jgi:hypothetical protein
LREPSRQENFRRGGRSARDLEAHCFAVVFYVMAESHDPQKLPTSRRVTRSLRARVG